MIVVSVLLISAIDGRSEELARMEICNMGTGSQHKGNYSAETLRGRSTADFAKRTRQRIGYVNGHARQREHVWNLVAKCLNTLRYGDRPEVEISGSQEITIISPRDGATDDGPRYVELADLDMPIRHYADQASAALGRDVRSLRFDLLPNKVRTFQVFAQP
jgi:hypothetical protein